MFPRPQIFAWNKVVKFVGLLAFAACLCVEIQVVMLTPNASFGFVAHGASGTFYDLVQAAFWRDFSGVYF